MLVNALNLMFLHILEAENYTVKYSDQNSANNYQAAYIFLQPLSYRNI